MELTVEGIREAFRRDLFVKNRKAAKMVGFIHDGKFGVFGVEPVRKDEAIRMHHTMVLCASLHVGRNHNYSKGDIDYRVRKFKSKTKRFGVHYGD